MSQRRLPKYPELTAEDYAAAKTDARALLVLLERFRPLIISCFWADMGDDERDRLVDAAIAKARAGFQRHHGGPRAVPGWLRTIAQNELRNSLRTRDRRRCAERRASQRRRKHAVQREARWQTEDQAVTRDRERTAVQLAEIAERDRRRKSQRQHTAWQVAGRPSALTSLALNDPESAQLALDGKAVEHAAWEGMAAPVLRDMNRRREIWLTKTKQHRLRLVLEKFIRRDWLEESRDVDIAIAQGRRLARLRRLIGDVRDAASTTPAISRVLAEIESSQIQRRKQIRLQDGTLQWASESERPLYVGTVANLARALRPTVDKAAALRVIDRVLRAENQCGEWGELRLRYPDVNLGRGQKGYPMDRRIREWFHSHGLSDPEIETARRVLVKANHPAAALIRPKGRAAARRARVRHRASE